MERGTAALGSTPDYVTAALAVREAANTAFQRLAPSHRREYLQWIEEARKPQTRARRIAKMIEKLQPTGTNGPHGEA